MVYKGKILVTDDIEPHVLEKLKELGDVTYLPKDVPAALKEAEVLVIRSKTKVTKDFLAPLGNCGKLKLIIRAGVAIDNVDQEYCRQVGISVTNTPMASSNAVAELALMLTLMCLRKGHKAHMSMHAKQWLKKELLGFELSGKTFGLIGLGRIGTRVGQFAHAFGANVIGTDPFVQQNDYAKVVSFDEVISKSDVISIHVPLTPQTKNLINKDQIAKMKPGVFLVNTSRGDLVNHDDLVEALKSGKIACAGLDVHVQEPYAGVLTEMDNVVLTPHIGASTEEAQTKIGDEVCRIVRKHFETIGTQ